VRQLIVAILVLLATPVTVLSQSNFPILTHIGSGQEQCGNLDGNYFVKFRRAVIARPTEESDAQTVECWRCDGGDCDSDIPLVTMLPATTVAPLAYLKQSQTVLLLGLDRDRADRTESITDCTNDVSLLDVPVTLTWYGFFTAPYEGDFCWRGTESFYALDYVVPLETPTTGPSPTETPTPTSTRVPAVTVTTIIPTTVSEPDTPMPEVTVVISTPTPTPCIDSQECALSLPENEEPEGMFWVWLSMIFN